MNGLTEDTSTALGYDSLVNDIEGERGLVLSQTPEGDTGYMRKNLNIWRDRI